MIALGSAQLGMEYGVASDGRPSAETAGAILRAAVDFGIHYIDTAAAYGDAERRIGRFLRDRQPAGLYVGTKLRALPGGLTRDGLNGAVVAEIARSSDRLGVDALDDVLIHSTENLREYGEWLVAALARGVQRGSVRRIGISVYDPDEVDLVLEHPDLSVVQFPFNVFDQRFAESGAVRRLRSHGRVPFARSVLLQGLLLLPSARAEQRVPGAAAWVETFQRICDDWRAGPLAGAVAFAAAADVADHLVIGVESVAQLEGVMAAAAWRAPEGLIEALRIAFVDVPRHVRDPRAWTRIT